MTTILVTGGAGFIGSCFVREMLAKHPDYRVVVLDKLTYAGNLDNLLPVAENPRYRFVQGDICDAAVVEPLVAEADAVVNFAAETHVDRSLLDPGSFINTDVFGVYVLLEAVRRQNGRVRFLQVSTDEVYGSVEQGSSREDDPLRPRSPYSASKVGGEMMVQAYYETYHLPVLVTRGSNTFGPYQYPEKVIPVFVTNALEDKPLPLYGDGLNVRDWLYVVDHCSAVDLVLHEGHPGQAYNVGGGNERTNLEVTETILRLLDKPRSLITFVTDRPGHDRRYSLDCAKIAALGWRPQHQFADAMRQTVIWYVENEWWWRKLRTADYGEYYRRNYAHRQQNDQPQATS
ncbi:MAG: dTDP-glucose 4,6-dehydratase [Dehalococcoidales bacterium]|nr:dTDP-glucose 4,6-dehydratase [Dehalococcoidales bacterium]